MSAVTSPSDGITLCYDTASKSYRQSITLWTRPNLQYSIVSNRILLTARLTLLDERAPQLHIMPFQSSENSSPVGSPAPKSEPMGSLPPTPSSAASRRTRDRVDGSEARDPSSTSERPLSLGNSILNPRPSKRPRVQHEHTFPRSPAQGSSYIDLVQTQFPNARIAQVPSDAENSVTIPFDPFEVPAYGKGPKLRFD